MIVSVWRFSHLALALSSCVFLVITAVTGIFLAFDPIIESQNNFRADSFDTLNVAQVVPALKQKYPGIQEVIINDNDFVLVKHSTAKGGDEQLYVNAATGEKLGDVIAKNDFFEWNKNLHRSLFLHETGRVIIGITAFLLILIALSGIMLVVKRQNGWKNFFSRVEKTSFMQQYHVVFGRWCLFFILAISLTGTYMAVYRFLPPQPKAIQKVNTDNIAEEPLKKINEFSVFKQTPLCHVKKIQYPFSDFPEDYYFLELDTREICVNQFTGDILAEQNYSSAHQLANFSLRWHTGKSGVVWAFLLVVASCYILFFIYSGFAIFLKRNRKKFKNKFTTQDAEIVILVGSENGATFRFAESIFTQLIEKEKKVVISDLNNYLLFPKAQHLIIMTSTHGQGDAPSNATQFFEKLKTTPQNQIINYSVLGFGSRSYINFCKFANDVDLILSQQSWAKQVLPVYNVNEKSLNDFEKWIKLWAEKSELDLKLIPESLEESVDSLKKLQVQKKSETNKESVFSLQLSATQLNKVSSGDLLAVYPENNHKERLYSIAKIKNELLLSVKLHEHGLGSGFLNKLNVGDTINARIIKNSHFHFPKKASRVLMISNGTGIAPFLGMISENDNKLPIELFCGFRYVSSSQTYNSYLNKYLDSNKFKVHHVFSREGEKEYVSDKLKKEKDSALKALTQNGVIMICGSLAMHNDVMAVLDEICKNDLNSSLKLFIDNGQIKTDCY